MQKRLVVSESFIASRNSQGFGSSFFLSFFHLIASFALGNVSCHGVSSAGRCALHLLKVPACCTSDLPWAGDCSS